MYLGLDSGNFSDNPNEEGELRTRVLLEGMAKLGYRAVNVGERDLALGFEAFNANVAGIGIEFVSANIVKQGTREPVFKPWVVIEVKPPKGGRAIRVGVLGVVRFNPVWQKAGPAGSNLAIAPPLEMVKSFLPEVRANADVVVLLASVSRDDAGRIAREAPGIDFVLGTYGGIFNSDEETEGTTRVFYTGNQGRRLGETRVFLDPEGKLLSSTSYLHNLTARYPDDPTMRAFVDEGNVRIGKIRGAGRVAAPAAAPR